MKTENTQQYHNPQNLDSPGIGFSFIPKGSVKEEGDEVWECISQPPRWIASNLRNGVELQHNRTYRRKLTEPKTDHETLMQGTSITREKAYEGLGVEPDYNSRENINAVALAAFHCDPWQHTAGEVWVEGSGTPLFVPGILYRVKPPEPTKLRVPLEAKDCPPGSVFSKNPETWWKLLVGVGQNGIHLHDETNISYLWLMHGNWLIKRPGSEWEPCYKWEEA